MHIPIRIEAHGSILEILDEKVIITPSGFFGLITRMGSGGKEIPYGSIKGIQFKEAGILLGYLSFTVLGSVEAESLFTARVDPNSVCFERHLNEKMLEVKKMIESKIASFQKNQTSKVSGAGAAEEIGKLFELKKAGAISDEEFEMMKSKLLKSA